VRRTAAARGRGDAAGEGDAEGDVPDRPGAGLRREPEPRLDEERVGEQRDEAAGVAGRIQRVRFGGRGPPVARRSGVPALEQRRAGGQHRERQSDAGDEEREHPGGRRDPVGQAACGDGHREGERRDREQPEVGRALPGDAAHAAEQVGVEVAAQEERLERHEAGVPDGRGAAEQGEQLSADERLDREEERRVRGRGAGEEPHRRPTGRAALWIAGRHGGERRRRGRAVATVARAARRGHHDAAR
jgi:hypothetical protein